MYLFGFSRHGKVERTVKIRSGAGIHVNDFLVSSYVRNTLGPDSYWLVEIIQADDEFGNMRFEIYLYNGQRQTYRRAAQEHSLPHVLGGCSLQKLTADSCPKKFNV